MSDTLHWSFGDNPILKEKVFAEGFSAPESTLPSSGFSPEGDWDNSYDLVYTGPQSFTEDKYVYYGGLRIGKRVAGNVAALKIREINHMEQDFRSERQHIESECVCCNEALLPLAEGVDWNVSILTKNRRDPMTAAYSEINETGRLKGGVIEKMDGGGKWYNYKKIDRQLPVVGNWSLLASVGGIGGDKAIEFGYFHKLESYSAGHKVRFLETFKADFGGREVVLNGYVQTGPSITPYFYWFDEQGRLLIARFALSALIFNENPRIEKEAAGDK